MITHGSNKKSGFSRKLLIFILMCAFAFSLSVIASAQSITVDELSGWGFDEIFVGENGAYSFDASALLSPSVSGGYEASISALNEIMDTLQGKNPDRVAFITITGRYQSDLSQKYMIYGVTYHSFDKTGYKFETVTSGSTKGSISFRTPQNYKGVYFNLNVGDRFKSGGLCGASLDRQVYYTSTSTTYRLLKAIYNPLGIPFPSNVYQLTGATSFTPAINGLPHKLTVNYIFEDGSQAAQPYNSRLEPTSEFSVNSPEIAGYTADQAVVSGVMADQDLTYTVTYKQIKHSLTIQYQFADGTKAADPYSAKYSPGSAVSVNSPKLSGYSPDQATVTGTMGNSDMNITVTYTPIKHTLAVHYQYEDGSQAFEPYSELFAEGDSFEVTSPSIGGYKPSVNIISGQMGNADLSYTVTYAQIKHTVTVKYQFEDGSEALKPYSGTIAEGQPYSIPTPALEGYTPSLNIISGEMGTGDLSYTVIFTKEKEPEPEPEPPPSSSEESSSGGQSSSGSGSQGGKGYVVWNPDLVAEGFRNMSHQAGTAFNTGIWVFLGITGIVLMVKLLRDLMK